MLCSHGMNRRDALRILGASLASLPGARTASGQRATARGRNAVRPNIVFIMTDDQRQDAMSAYGNPILRTPNMDAIGAGGMRFTEFFVTNSLCQPSRASFLTGLYSHSHGVLSNGGGPDFVHHPGRQAVLAALSQLGAEHQSERPGQSCGSSGGSIYLRCVAARAAIGLPS